MQGYDLSAELKYSELWRLGGTDQNAKSDLLDAEQFYNFNKNSGPLSTTYWD